MGDLLLAIDQGTTGTRVIAYDRQARPVAQSYREFTQYYPKPGWVEHDANEIWESTLTTLHECLERAEADLSRVHGIGITNQRETVVIWDRATSRPVHRAIVWQCRRTADMCNRLKAEGREALFRRKTGLVLDAYFSGTKIRWILDQDPALAARARAGELAAGTMDTWLIWKLTNGASHVTDPTNASRTLLYDIHRRDWSDQLGKLLGVPRALLPKVRPSSGEFGRVSSQLGLGGTPPISGVAGDQQAALYGQGAWKPGMGKNTYGTGCFLLMNTGKELVHSRRGLLTTLACDARGRPAYALEGSVFIAGAAIQWLRDELGLIGSAAESEELARAVDDTAGVYMVPAFVGLGAPYWDMDARGALVGLTRGANRKHVVRATLEALAYQTKDVCDAMVADAGLDLRELRVDGGACRNDFLMQFQADVLGCAVDRPTIIETTALGAAFLAGLGSGFWSSPDEVAGVRETNRRFEPTMDRAVAARLYDGWRAAVARVRSTGEDVATKRPGGAKRRRPGAAGASHRERRPTAAKRSAEPAKGRAGAVANGRRAAGTSRRPAPKGRR